jgi:hypothetical protein
MTCHSAVRTFFVGETVFGEMSWFVADGADFGACALLIVVVIVVTTVIILAACHFVVLD